ncbi:DMT family transporter [Paenibacillus donghaensis]|uniref:EamA family transporter n=1 Tax=Paenibacillus donghaensis TaxID=414771 RepID=A0A2Z2KHX0_9BACL|nr:DMT family transporter [Paenibacillus donghaensis]ASA25864.1 EamA family transporter [Paenibacillus donghaensis]
MRSTGLKLAYAFAVMNAVIIGFSFLFTKMALAEASPLDTLTYRFIASFVIMTVPVVCGWIKVDYRGKPIGRALLLATMYPLGFFTLQVFGLRLATSAEGGILYSFTPVVTMIIASVFLKERTTLAQKLCIFLSVFGVVFIFIMKGGGLQLSNLSGILLLFLTTVAFAGYSVLARSLSKAFTPAEIGYLMMTVGFVTFLLISLSGHVVQGTLGDFFKPLASRTFIYSCLYLGIAASLVTTLTSNYILSKIEASAMSVFTNLSTIVSIAAGALVLGEEVTIYHVIGSVLIILGVVGTNLRRRQSVRGQRIG